MGQYVGPSELAYASLVSYVREVFPRKRAKADMNAASGEEDRPAGYTDYVKRLEAKLDSQVQASIQEVRAKLRNGGA